MPEKMVDVDVDITFTRTQEYSFAGVVGVPASIQDDETAIHAYLDNQEELERMYPFAEVQADTSTLDELTLANEEDEDEE